VKLSQLLKPWFKPENSDCVIENLQNDSRKVQAGDLFIAYPGAAADGRLYIDKAVAAGAVAIAYEPNSFSTSVVLSSKVPCVPVPDLAEQLGVIAKTFFDSPSADLNLIGVTGTNGKTTIAYQLAQAHQLLGQKSAYIGTIGQGDVNDLQALDNTTPDALCLQRLMNYYRAEGVKQVCMEVSSHALSQHRVDALHFSQAVFTNLTLDHLDYHKSMYEYAAAKALLFARPELEFAIINQDDSYQKTMSEVLRSKVKKITYGLHADCDVKAVRWHMDINGTEIDIHSPWGQHQLKIKALGKFNLYNCLAIYTSLLASGYEASQVTEIIAQLKSAPGRMEVVAQEPYILVDYAHTPDALENVLLTLNQLKKGRLWVIFGCGGDRDKSKRPVMGKVASLYSDNIVITSDNPRTEDPALIVDEIATGVDSSFAVTKLINREEAIAHAINLAEKEDIILIAGKGHEAYQQIGSVKHSFSDQEIVKKLLFAL